MFKWSINKSNFELISRLNILSLKNQNVQILENKCYHCYQI